VGGCAPKIAEKRYSFFDSQCIDTTKIRLGSYFADMHTLRPVV